MEIGSFYPTSLTKTVANSQSLQLKEGQMVHGKIDKILSDSTVQVQIGSSKVMAQINTPVSLNERHWFQIRFQNNQLLLDVVPNLNKDTLKAEEILLKQLQLEQKPTTTQLIQMLKENNLPISKEVVMLASQWIESTSSLTTGLDAIKLLLQKNLPLSKESFLAFVSLLEEPSTINQFNQLKEMLKANPKLSEKESQLLPLLTKLSQSEGEKMGSLLVDKLVNEVILNTKNASNAQAILKALQLYPSHLSKNEEIVQLIGSIKASIVETNTTQLTKQLEQLTILVKNQLPNHPLTNQLEQLTNVSKLPIGLNIVSKTFESVTSELNQALVQNGATSTNVSTTNNSGQTTNQLNQLLSGNFDEQLNLTKDQKVLILQLVRELQVDRLNLTNSETVKNYLQDILKSLGLSHEKMLATPLKVSANEQLIETNLKSLLLAIRNESTGEIQEVASKLVARLTGFQLSSLESNNFLQLNYQLPIPFWNQTKDLTISWTGKKDKQGKIDADHCRILFYLDFETIGMTTVDMQVQNRMIHVKVVNEIDQLKSISQPFIQNLKENLEKLNYQLSHITFSKPLKEALAIKSSHSTLVSMISSNEHVGVDIRI